MSVDIDIKAERIKWRQFYIDTHGCQPSEYDDCREFPIWCGGARAAIPNENESGALLAAGQHLKTVTVQSAIILGQQKEIDRLNAQLAAKVDESARLRQQLAALEDRLLHPIAPMNRSTGMRCPGCYAKADEPHAPGCTEAGS